MAFDWFSCAMLQNHQYPIVAALALAYAALMGSQLAAAEGNENKSPSLVEIRKGTATFDATTNFAAISIHGRSTAVVGRAQIRSSGDGLVIDQLEALVPVKTLNTGLSLRDDHMRKHVFALPDGSLPDLRFVSDRVTCTTSGNATTCELDGALTIRAIARPFAITLKLDDRGNLIRATGDGLVKLSAYGIAQPTQLGVTTTDDVRFHVDVEVPVSLGSQ